MSVLASVTIEFGLPVSVSRLVSDLIDSGWTYNDYNQISYLPLGNNDLFDWQRADMAEWARVEGVVETKAQKKELVGLVLTWQDTMIGGEFLMRQGGVVLDVCLSCNRQCKDDGRNTDFDWYLPRLLKLLQQRGYSIVDHKCVQID